MRRSEINKLINEAKCFFEKMNFKLPVWATWGPAEWKGKYSSCSEIVDNMMGWDLTDFGSGDFKKRGLILFTIRNGNMKNDKKGYCEKIMISGINQETPMHFHWNKMEDIINRGGGKLIMELHMATKDEQLSNENVKVKVDGILKEVKAGSKLIINPGESICLEPYMYHRFYAEESMAMIGEVSAVNDDTNDNRFYETIGRFPEIIEDQEPLHLLVSDYKKYL